MTKSRFVFFILGIAYLGIAIGSLLSIFSINNNVLLGLSISSCLISVGELVNSIGSYFSCRNSFCYSLHYASDFLKNCIDNNVQPKTNVDTYNIKFGIDETLSGRKSCHPVEYDKKRIFPILRAASQGLFILGIVCFILIPFANHEINTQTASRIITIVAFAFMCLNIGVNDWTQETISAKMRFEYDKVVIIDDAFDGFTNGYYYHLQHYTAYNEIQKKSAIDSNCVGGEKTDVDANTSIESNTSNSLFERLQNTR